MSGIRQYHRPGDRMDWGTPRDLYERYNARHGFTVDVCAHEHNAKHVRYWSPAEDGLAQDWSGEVCWMNPPYGREIRAWMKKAYEESQRGATVVCLVPARTDAAWWHDYAMKGEIEFIRGRVKFEGAQWNAPFPCAVVVLRPPKATHEAA